MFLSFISKAEQYFAPSKAPTSRHPIDRFTPSTLAEAPYDMAPKKSDFPSLKSPEFSQTTVDQHSLSEIKKKWDKYAHEWPQDIRETVLRLLKLVKANPSNSKAPSSHAIWKLGHWNFGHWVVMNSIYGDNSGSLSNMKYRLKDEFPNVNFDDFRGVGLKAAEDGSEEDGNSQKKTKKRKPSRSPKKSSRPKRRPKSTASEALEDEGSTDREFREKLALGVKKEPRSESKGRTPMPQIQTASAEAFFNHQSQPMNGYGYPTHGYGGQSAYMPMRAAQPMGMMGPMQNGNGLYNVETTATMSLRQEMNDRLAAQDRAHAADIQRLCASFEDKLRSTKEEIYASMQLFLDRTMALERKLGDEEEN